MNPFNPSRDEVRSFFIESWKKIRDSNPASPLETLAGEWVREHPEYHKLLSDNVEEAAGLRAPEGEANPFLHLSMHLSISEQVSIDQPPGIRAAAAHLEARLGSLHDAQHAIMECLGETLWNAERNGSEPDGVAYLECIERRARQR
jgi:hypothetical protein